MSERSVTLCGHRLGPGVRHVCAFVDSRDEQHELLDPYFREGIEQGERVVTIVESSHRAEHLHRLGTAGLTVDPLLESGRLQVLASEDTYTQGGAFVVDRMYTMLEQALRDAQDGPFTGIRTCGDMEWALANLPGTDELMQYESKVNLLTERYDCTLLCVYDANRFSGRVVADVLATHSHVVLGGRVHENPYFVDTHTFLQKLSLRRGRMAPLQREGASSPRPTA